MRIKIVLAIALGGALSVGGSHALAVPVDLDSAPHCGVSELNSIDVGDVISPGLATDCWGTFDGNDPGPSGDGFQMGTMIFDFVAKEDTPGSLTGADIGLEVLPSGGGADSGTWTFDITKFQPTEFLVVLKAGDSPGYAVWHFDDYTEVGIGAWTVAWDKDLSHLSIYAKPGGLVPEPGTLGLLGVSLVAIGLSRRRRKKSQ